MNHPRHTARGHRRERAPANAARLPPGLVDGRVIRAYGRQLVVEDATGQAYPCRAFGKDLRAVCGDQVGFLPEGAGDGMGLVHVIRERRGVLARWNTSGQREELASHLTRLVVVFAPAPAPDLFVVDRYLAAAALAGLECIVVCTKADLLVPGAPEAAASSEIHAALAAYGALGYPVFLLDTRTAEGFAPLAAALATGTSVLVGQSGVGKSSLLNQLVPEAVAATQTISASTDEGRHTTTSAALYHLPGGGDLIDSPGVRDFAPPVPEPRQARHGFVEIEALSAGCRFLDCLHREEPGCAVRTAVDAAAVEGQPALTQRRYTSYRRLLNTALQMEERRPPGR